MQKGEMNTYVGQSGTVISPDIEWQRITKDTERHRKMFLLTEGHVGVVGELTPANRKGYHGWFPYPKIPANLLEGNPHEDS